MKNKAMLFIIDEDKSYINPLVERPMVFCGQKSAHYHKQPLQWVEYNPTELMLLNSIPPDKERYGDCDHLIRQRA